MKTLKMIPVLGAASLAFSAVCFDYSMGDGGAGTLTGDGSWFQAPGTALVEAQAESGTWYPAAQPLDIDACPNGGENGVSACYYGWNDADMLKPEGATVRVTLSAYANPTGWGYTNGGLLYILDGTGLENASDYKLVDIGSSVTVKAQLKAGTTGKVFLLESSYNSADANAGLYKANIVGTGAIKEYTFTTSSDFTTWASNVMNAAQTRAIAVEYEIGATAEGAAFPGEFKDIIIWQSLAVGGSCAGSGAIGDKVAAKSVGFAALRGGLQFSNIPAGAVLNVQMFNTLGKVVSSHKVTSKNSFVSTEGLNNGVYVVRATDGAKLNLMRNVTIMK